MATDESNSDVPTLGVGMLGYAFMGKAHTNAYKTMDYIYMPPPAHARLVAIAGRNREQVEAAARRYGYQKALTDWHELVSDPEVQVFDNSAPNYLHAEPTIAAARAGKHVICEKPLGKDAAEAKAMWEAAKQAGVVHMCAFNYRFVPALRLARDIIRAGRLGRIYHFRAQYLHEGLANPQAPLSWRLHADDAGTGALGDLGTHIIDLARFLVGEPTNVSAMTRTFVTERPTGDGGTGPVDVDDAFAALLSFENGALGTLEATRYARGRKNHQVIEINGEKGSIAFNLERLDELEVYLPEEETTQDAQGFRQVLVTESTHPFYNVWWPHGHIIGWENTFVHELHHFFTAITSGGSVAPDGADFEDGYRANVIAEAILAAAHTGQQVAIAY